ncbi:hypothetical protein MAP_1347c [Mycobacterium avium subsp. paratuberculosis K-10]|uniref:GAF domain-containing protein n=1 Tax=Mycolicibacterium paratuberculosis (strain ATCC BAA-968 / K-10) TaxID=262316 RepID=Q740K3_MYCPA|nr:hypothetical protein MAP_1347c [Mycobacterium avium subsp. paratuberculosis K-10]
MSGTLDYLVTAAAAELMAATAADSAAISQRVLGNLVRDLGVDFSFLRHNDHTIRATILVAEWPPRNADPDPLGVVYFADADSVFAQAEHLKAPQVVRPEAANADYQRNIDEGTGWGTVSLAAVPLLSGDVTTGTLAFGKAGDREWLPEELNALQAIAALFAQLQARVVAEKQIHYLAEHDELTGLLNRRALIAYLTSASPRGNRARSRSCSWPSTGSRSSTVASGNTPATGSSRPSPRSSARPSTFRRSSLASAVTSSLSCPRRQWTSKRPRRSPGRCTACCTSRSRSTTKCLVAQ